MTWILVVAATALGSAAERYLHSPSQALKQKTATASTSPRPTTPTSSKENPPRPTLDTVLNAGRFELRPILAEFLPAATAQELEVLAAAWSHQFDTDTVSSLCRKMLLARWVDLDPKRALEIEKSARGWRLSGWCYRIWSERDPLAALAAAQEEENAAYILTRLVPAIAKEHLLELLPLIDAFPHESDLLCQIFSEWTRTAPKEALARVDTLSGSVREEVREAVLEILATESTESALAMVRNSESPTVTKRNQESAILGAMIDDDPLSATPHVLAMEPCRKRYELVRKLARKRAASDPEGTLAWGKTLPPGSEKKAVIAKAVAELDLDLEQITALLDEIGWENTAPNPQDTTEIMYGSGSSSSYNTDGSLLEGLKEALKKASQKEDLPAVMTVLGKLPGNRHETIQNLAEIWFAESPSFLQSVISQLPDRKLAASAIGSIVNVVRDENTVQMMAETLQTFTPDQRRYPLRTLANKYAEINAEAAINWATTLTDETERNEALGAGINAISHHDPQAAIEALATLPQSEARRNSIATITGALVAKDIPQALDWIASLSEADVSARTYQEITRGWFRKDPLAVSEWVGQLSEGEHRDGAVSALAQSLAYGSRADFEAAIAWAESMSHDENHRTLGGVYRAWLSHDRAAALEALADSSLPLTEQEAIRSR